MILYGASGHAKIIIDILQLNNIAIKLLIDDNLNIHSFLNFKVTNTDTFDLFKTNEELIIAIGNNKARKKIVEKFPNNKYGIAIHPKSSIAKLSSINFGTVIAANATINAHANIGKHCIINTNAVIEHDCIINNYVHISPSATLCGNVTIGEGTHVGAGAIIIPNVKIGKWCIIGAGSIVIKDIPNNTTVVGNPARNIK